MKKILFTLALLLSLGSTLCIEKAAAQDYIIRNENDWLAFRNAVGQANGNRVDARLEADISTGGGIGVYQNNPYCGTFDGNGHTITATNIWRDDSQPCALFCYVKDATIKNLHVKGAVTGGIHSAGLIGKVLGSSTVTVNRVWVSTEVDASSATHAGGIIGHSDYARVYMNDCRFDGRVTTNNSSDSYAGDIIGWCNGGGWNLQRVYDQGSLTAQHMYFCIDFNGSSATNWGTNGNSFTVTHHNWNTVDHYNKSNQYEVLSLMNGKKADSWELVGGQAVPNIKPQGINGWDILSEGSSSGHTLYTGHYYVDQNVTFSNGATGSGLTIADGATVYLYIPHGVTLTARGGHADGQTGAGAGIELPESSTLYLQGKGTVKAYGGNAADGGRGGDGGNAGYSYDTSTWTGGGGKGGYGGGGAGAGIGTRGADGGTGGSGGSSNTHTDWKVHNGTGGSKGGTGGTALAMGTLYIETTYGLDVDANGGSQGTSGGDGGNRGNCAIDDDESNNYSMSGGGGGGGGGFGGIAANIGTGGCGGGGGGGGAGGAQDWTDSGYYNVYSPGGKGGANADGNTTASNGLMSDCDYRNSYTYSNYKWSDGAYHDKSGACSMGSGGESGEKGDNSVYEDPSGNEHILKFNVLNQAGDNTVADHATITYQCNKSNVNIPVTIPTTYKLGLIKADKYVSRWYTSNACTGDDSQAANDVKYISRSANANSPTNLYGVWQNYKPIFPDGTGTKSDPFIIKDDGLLDLADYVNQGGNTRGVYFKQQGDINAEVILADHNMANQWGPIGYIQVFEGDYDGDGYRIINAKNSGTELPYNGIFGKVSGSIHNLGVEGCDLQTSVYERTRGGAIAGILLRCDLDQATTAEIRNCYAAGNKIRARNAGGLVGSMTNASIMSHCLESRSDLNNGCGGIVSTISKDCQLDKCFTSGPLTYSSYSLATNSEEKVSYERLGNGEITWLLNNQSPYGGPWYQNIDSDLYPVLDKQHKRVYYYWNSTYTNNGAWNAIPNYPGAGTAEDPIIIPTRAALIDIANFCNNGNNTAGIHFLQVADIDLQGQGITPIGSSHAFAGIYDGGGHTIRNGSIAIDGIAGIFGVVSGTVNRLCVENTTVKFTKDGMRAGGIAARITGNGVISNCLVKGCTISNDGQYGGVVGGIVADMFDQGVIKNCLVINTTLQASRTASICSDSEIGNSLVRCYTDGSALVSGSSYATTVDCELIDNSQLTNGTYTYLLNNSPEGDNLSPAWFQNISLGANDPRNADPTPVLSPDHAIVFKRSGKYTNDYRGIGSKGSGTQGDPYRVTDADDLRNISETFEAMRYSNFYVKQTADIDLKEAESFAPIGVGTSGFTGHYDGGGHVISNWSISECTGITRLNVYDTAPKSIGLFNNIIGTVERLGIVNSVFTVDANAKNINRVGAFAGKMTGSGQLLNCYAAECAVSYNYKTNVVVGALVGEQADQSRIENSYGYKNTVVGETKDNQKHYGYITGYIGSNAAASHVYTDGASLCADNQGGASKITDSERNVDELRFKTGEMTFLLNNSVNYYATQDAPVWYQTIKTDVIPVLKNTSGKVYRHVLEQAGQTMYANDVPYYVPLTLDPYYKDDKGEDITPTVVNVFKADDRYYVPAYNLGNSIPNRNYYAFAGWNTNTDGTGTHYDKNGEILVSEAATLFAEWDMTVPSDGTTLRVDLTAGKTFNIYDAAGKDTHYGYNYGGKLVLKAPPVEEGDGHNIIYLTGTIATEALTSGQKRDYLVVRDGGLDGTMMSNNQSTNVGGYGPVFVSATNGAEKNIGRLLSTKDSITIEFYSDNDNNFAGLRLRATVISDINQLGKGTQENPFKVNCAADLATIQEYIQATHNTSIWIQQTADIDLEEGTLTPLGTGESSFAGRYDGCGHVIKNGNIETTDGHLTAGIFSIVTGTVTRLGVENITVQGLHANARIGGIAGRVNGSGVISNCYVKNCTVTSDVASVTGGIVGDMCNQAVIRNCFTLGNTLKGSRTGQICADTDNSTQQITRCYTDGNQIINQGPATVTDCSTSITEYQLKSGEICHLLNSSSSANNVVWRQTIGTDAYPVPDSQSPIVYYYDQQGHQGYTNEATPALATLRVQDVAFNQSVDHQAIRGSLIRLNNYPPERANLTLAEWNTQADFTGTSYASDANLLLNSDVIILYPKWNIMPQVITGEGTEQSPYIINNTEDWNKLATNITYFNSTFNGYLNKHIRLNADISVTEMIGTEGGNNPFRGTFDGYGHTLTVSIGTAEAPITERFCGPFRYTKEATIKNLKTTGDIYTSNINAGGVVGRIATDGATLENVSSDVAIHSTFSGAGYHGGLVGYAINASFTTCAFTGKLLGANNHHIGGLLGQKSDTNGSNASFTNCLFAPAEVTVSTDNSYPFAAGAQQRVTIASNCYNTASLGNAQGTQVQTTATDNELNRKVTICNTTVYVVEVCTVSGIDANYDMRTAAVSITPVVTAPNSMALSYGNDFTATLNGDAVAQLPIDINEVGDYTLVLTGTGDYVGTKTYHFTVIGDHVRITLVEDVGTYSSNDDLNFTGSALNAYIAAGYNKSENQVLLVRVYDVPAGTGIFLRGQANESYNIPKSTSQSYYVNMLKAHVTAGPVAQTEDGKTNFLLGKVNDVIKFYAASANASLGDNKAYLQVPTSFLTNNNAREVNIVFEEDVTGITDMEGRSGLGGRFYDLQGRLVIDRDAMDTKPMKKGLYIHNGKKIVIK